MLTDNQIEAFEFLMKKANIEYGQTYKIECDLFNGSFIIEKKKKEICVDYKNKMMNGKHISLQNLKMIAY